MFKKVMAGFLLSALVLSTYGCVTVSRQKDLELQAARNQVSVLQTRLQAKDQEIEALKSALSKKSQAQEQIARKKTAAEPKTPPTIKQVQLALKNAGYNPGQVDGRDGKQTRDAVKAFQKANNLAVDGTVGPETWVLLAGYLKKD